jgi:hypothetical protein
MLLFAAIKDVVDTAHAMKDVINVTKMVSITKPTEDVELDGVTLVSLVSCILSQYSF